MHIYKLLGIKNFEKLILNLCEKILYRNKPNMTIEEKRKRIRDVPSNYNIGKVKNLEAMKSFKKKLVFNAIIHFFQYYVQRLV